MSLSRRNLDTRDGADMLDEAAKMYSVERKKSGGLEGQGLGSAETGGSRCAAY